MMVITAVGNLTRDVEVKQRSDGSSYMQGSVAINSGKDQVTYVTFFSSNTKLAQYLKKGKPLGVSGNATIQTYTAKDGTKKMSISISDAAVSFVNTGSGKSGNKGGGYNSPNRAAGGGNSPAADINDIPF